MYHIELLPSSSAHITPGWTYVPDRGFDPAQAAIAPAIGRKRGIRDPGGRGDVSSRENNAILRHLTELDRENHRDIQIAIPVKQKDAAGRGTRGKVTSNVRRILQSQKTFRNHLDDEEAFLSQTAQTTGTGAAGGANAPQRPAINRITKPAQRRSSTPVAAPKAEPTGRQRKRTPAAQLSTPAGTSEAPAVATDTSGPAAAAAEDAPPTADTEHLISSEYDDDPLLRSRIPSVPSDRIMQALLSEPPLPYNASRAGPPIARKPPRFFCAICGYWGKIRCRSCHVRTCGLDCYKVHEESRCGAFL